MKVDLKCVTACYVDVRNEGRQVYCERGREFEGVEINGDEGWLKLFNAYEHVPKVEPKRVKRKLMQDVGHADDSEKPPIKPEDIGAGKPVSIEKLMDTFTQSQLIQMLHEDGLKNAAGGWKKETLAKHVQERRAYVGKL